MRGLCVLTGASRGYGEALAVEFCKGLVPEWLKVVEGVDILLTARSSVERTVRTVTTTLEQMKEEGRVRILDLAMDLGNLDTLEKDVQKLFGIVDAKKYSRAILFSNAGSLGSVKNVSSLEMSLQTIRSAVDLNVVSFAYLNVQFLKFCSSAASPSSKFDCTIVQISSLAAVKEFPSLSLYCSGKAFRDMHNRCITAEAAAGVYNPHLSVTTLNYAPGPMDTDMTVKIEKECDNASMQDYFGKLRREHTLVDMNESAAALMWQLRQPSLVSGSHIDIFDIKDKVSKQK